MVLGLLLSGCATTSIPSGEVIDKNENYIILTHDVWGGFKGTIESERVKLHNIASNHCTKYNKFAFWYSGSYSDTGTFKYFCRTTYDKSFSNAQLYWTNYDSAQQTQRDITFTIDDKKEQCEAIGFEPQTEKFADCVLRLVELDVKSQQANQIALAESQGNQQIADELRAQRNQQSGAYLMDLGQKLLNPPTKKTTRCTVTGVGSFKTVSCR